MKTMKTMKEPKMKLVDPAKLSKRQLVDLARTLQRLFFLNKNKSVDLDSLECTFDDDFANEVVQHLDCYGLARVRIGRKEMDFNEAEEYLGSLEQSAYERLVVTARVS